MPSSYTSNINVEKAGIGPLVRLPYPIAVSYTHLDVYKRQSILTYLSSTVTPDDFGGPISFSASNIKDNSVFVNYFNVQ